MAEWITSLVGRLGYLGVAALMFLENVFPPIPSELIMPLAGFGAARGEFSIVWVIVAGVVGSTLGQYPLYALGRSMGEERLRRFADKHGKWVTVSGREIDKAGGWFEKHGGMAVLLCRLVPGVRSLISIPAGIHRMSLVSFTLYSAAGMTVWTTVLAGLGYLLGRQYERVERYVGPIGYVVAGLAVAGIAAWVGRRIWNCRQRGGASCPPGLAKAG